MRTEAIKKICFATGTRADWGLLMPLAKALALRDDVEVSVAATNMHLMPQYGSTLAEIEAAGLNIAAKVDMCVEGDDGASRALASAKCLEGMTRAFTAIAPDAVVILGDRYEMLATAMAACLLRIPIIHIAGGEVSEGAVDDVLRHAITKLSAFHLTATEDYRQRVIQMGEQPERVVNTGAIGVWNAFNTTLLSAQELGESIGFNLCSRPVAAVTYHPATADDASPAQGLQAMLDALEEFDYNYVITAPNNDAGGAALLPILERFAESHPDNVRLVRSLGMVRYQSLLRCADMVIGNSSSGIVEVPSAGIPTVDIGPRQKGRLHGPSVIHCGTSTTEIAEAIRLAGSESMQQLAAKKENPYYQPDTLEKMVSAVMEFVNSDSMREPKHFHDLK